MPSADRLLQQVLYRIFRINQRKSLPRAKISVEHLKEYFEHAKVVNITSPKIKAYIEERKKLNVKSVGKNLKQIRAALLVVAMKLSREQPTPQ